MEKEFPGIEFNFSQYLQDNVAEAVSGVKGENSIKLFGNDLRQLTEVGAKIKKVLSTVPGVADLAVFAATRPADRADRHRSRQSRALWPGAGRYQRNHQDRDRRRPRRRPL